MRTLLFSILFAAVPGSGFGSRAPAPEVAAEYHTVFSMGKNTTAESWRFERTVSQVLHLRDGRIDRWTRLGPDEIALEQIHPAEMLVLEFTQGDLKSIGGSVNWITLIHLVETNLFARLKLTGTTKVLGKKALQYRGRAAGADWQILWIPELALPASIERSDQAGRMKTRLTKLPARREAVIDSGFQRIDFADVGDMESHAALQRVLKRSRLSDHRH